MTFKAPDSLSEQIAQHLAERIIRGELKERERIQEQKVTQAMNVSRGSVREALLILERRHLITILPRRGAQVSELTQQHVRSLYTLVMELYILLGYAVADIVTEQRLYLADTAILLATVRRADDAARSLMLIGHNPGLTDFANSLTPDRRIDNLPTTGLFVVDFPVDRWREISPGAASFVAFDAPKNRPGS